MQRLSSSYFDNSTTIVTLPSEPEIPYPYPLYKTTGERDRKEDMKPNQVSSAAATLYSPMLARQLLAQVGTVFLYGVRIVSLSMDGKERLCLAQISNTLLKEYSYNEIHNRRVALGITCVQCTPVQVGGSSSSFGGM